MFSRGQNWIPGIEDKEIKRNWSKQWYFGCLKSKSQGLSVTFSERISCQHGLNLQKPAIFTGILQFNKKQDKNPHEIFKLRSLLHQFRWRMEPSYWTASH